MCAADFPGKGNGERAERGRGQGRTRSAMGGCRAGALGVLGARAVQGTLLRP